jgi:hypothetical protein
MCTDIEAECQDDYMKIRIGFNGSFSGLLYSSGNCTRQTDLILWKLSIPNKIIIYFLVKTLEILEYVFVCEQISVY